VSKHLSPQSRVSNPFLQIRYNYVLRKKKNTEQGSLSSLEKQEGKVLQWATFNHLLLKTVHQQIGELRSMLN